MDQGFAVPAVPDGMEASFSGFRLKADGTLLRGEIPVHLPPKELAALRLLMANAGRIVTPNELRDALWSDVHVSGDSVPKCVSSLRSLLHPEECIQTIYKRGYRFTAEVQMEGNGSEASLPRIAILPFSVGNGVSDYLGSVIAEETMTRLNRVRPTVLHVLAQDSVFTLARRGLTAQQIGEMLRADMVLAGSLSALPLKYRLRAEMIRVKDGVQVWVEDFLVDRSRLAGLETEFAKRLAFRLGCAIASMEIPAQGPEATAASEETPAEHNGAGLPVSAAAEPSQEFREAYEIFERAHHEWQSLQRHRMQDGLQHLLRATELAPALLGARVDLVNLCVAQCFYGFMSPATEADIVRRATEAISDLPERAGAVLPSLGWISFHFDRNLPAALRLFSLSAHLPHDAWITRARSMFALSRSRFEETVELLQYAIQQDPYAPWLQARLAWAFHLAGEAGRSVDQVCSALAQFPEHEGTNLYGAIILAYNGKAEQAVELAQELTQRLSYFDLATSAQAYAMACAGRVDEARAILERLQWLSRERYLLKTFMPAVYLALGETESALAELRFAEECRCPWFFQTLADPRLKALHGHAEFERMQSILDGMEAQAARYGNQAR